MSQRLDLIARHLSINRSYLRPNSLSVSGKIPFEIIDLNLNPHEDAFRTQMIQLLDNVKLKGIYVSTSKGTALAASVLESHGKNDIRMIGYDILSENLKYLRSGTIDFLINQNPKRQALLSISHLVNHLMFKKSAPPMDLFPLEIITQQNVDSYLGSGIH